jgi:CRISPR system Cascade subunit CasE
MTLQMLRLDPDPHRFADWAAREKLLMSGADPCYAWHAILRAAFGELAPRPFRLVERRGRSDYLIGYGTADAVALRDHAAAFADPLVSGALNMPSLAVKSMPTSFRTGTRLGFEVRVRPVIRQDRDGDRRRTRECDAFLAAINGPDADKEVDRERVYVDWLRVRLANGGAEVGASRAISLRRSRVLRRRADRKPVLIEGPDVVLDGTLTVVEPNAFAALLARGVGRHRAFGFGMLLLKPPRDAPPSNLGN